MSKPQSKILEDSLKKPEIHHQWESGYRTPENEKFFEKAFDYIIRVINPPKSSTFLDAGCGICAHSMRLASRGFFVKAVDFSENILGIAEKNVKTNGFESMITIQRENILALSFEDRAFNYILCWGVLMHIADIEKAIFELARVLKPGGKLIISEGNMHSLESKVLRNLKRLLRKEKDIVKKTPSGIEHWSTTPAGMLLTRQTNIKWLIGKFNTNHCTIIKHISGQFSEGYIRFSNPSIRNLTHCLNNIWFQYIEIPYFAFGNILILQKEK